MLIHALRVVDILITMNTIQLGSPFERKTEITKTYLSFVFCYFANYFTFVLQTESNQKEI